MSTPRRITVQDAAAGDLREPLLTTVDLEDYLTGWELFNRGEYWHAHEAWEAIWKRHPEPWRLFLEGIIQLAAAFHLLTVKRRFGGMMGNFAKADEKLRLFERVVTEPGMDAVTGEPQRASPARGAELQEGPHAPAPDLPSGRTTPDPDIRTARDGIPGSFLGVDVRALLQWLEAARAEAVRLGAGNLREFPPALLPRVVCAPPSPLRNPARRP